MFSLYPMKFNAILKDKIWGGKKIREQLGIFDETIEKCGELWLLSSVEGSESHILNGHFSGNTVSEMAEIFMEDLLGEDIYKKYKTDFPLLLKVIDANDYLSVQVHPNDEIARKKHGLKFGKSEMWYVIQADPGAQIIAGFNQPMDKEKLKNHIAKGTLRETLNFETMNSGDMVYLPAGMIHAMGPGLLIAEIQQSSDVTYRLYDWDRLDDKGNPRELHVDEAADAIDFTMKPQVIRGFVPGPNTTNRMIDTPYFSSSMVNLQAVVEKNLEIIDLFVIYFSVKGSFELLYNEGKIDVKAGECVLVPAITEKVILIPKPEAQVIEIVPC
jgi:mannose-6-phosphate isomerase